jgi:hypothetical protein
MLKICVKNRKKIRPQKYRLGAKIALNIWLIGQTDLRRDLRVFLARPTRAEKGFCNETNQQI